MNRTVSECLRKYYAQNSNNLTHVSCITPRGRFSLDRYAYDELMKTYSDEFKKSQITLEDIEEKSPVTKPEFMAGIAELPEEWSMMVVDADIKIKVEADASPRKLYTDEHIQSVVSIYQTIMKERTLGLKPSDDHLFTCVLLEKDPYIEDGYNKSGFHLAFIYYFCCKAAQDIYLLPKICEIVDEQAVFEDIGFPISSKVLDISSCNNKAKPWLMYGSRKSTSANYYQATKAYLLDGSVVPLEDVLMEYTIYDVENNEIDMSDDMEYFYPRIFSIVPYGRRTVEIQYTTTITSLHALKEARADAKNENISESLENSTIDDRMHIADELVRMISPSRAESYEEWIQMGSILHQICEGNDAGLELWKRFSSQCSEKYSEAVCVSKWNKFIPTNYTLGTLKYFAQNDNPEEYHRWKHQHTQKHLYRALDFNHYDLARALYEMYSNIYVCANLTPRPSWYYFSNHHWEPMEKAVYLREKISTDLFLHYTQLGKQEYHELSVQGADSERGAAVKKRIDAIGKLLGKLKNVTFKNSIIHECEDIFYDPRFREKLGTNPMLIGVRNGVIDLNNFVFRPGQPEDYVSLQMPVDFRDDITEMDPWHIELTNFFDKVFVKASVREYFLDSAAEYFIGGNPRKDFQVWSGPSNGGKSVTQKLFMELFGKYAVDVPTPVLTGAKPRAGVACPELARAGDGVRLIFSQEPNSREEINIGSIKGLSGNDRFFIRGLYEKGIEIEPMFKLILVCNSLPRLPCDDPATWNRIKVIPFESVFCDNAPLDEEEQKRLRRFPKDNFFHNKIPFLLTSLLSMLVRRLEHNRRTNKRIIVPPEVSIATETYRKNNDSFGQFVDEQLLVDPKGRLGSTELYSSFRNWFKSSYSNLLVPNKAEVVEIATTRWGKPVNHYWNGYRQRIVDDEVAPSLRKENQRPVLTAKANTNEGFVHPLNLPR